MTNKKNIYILLAVLIVLCAATAAVFMWDGTGTQNDEIGSFEEDSIYIYNGNADELTQINVTLPKENIEFVKVDNAWQIAGLEGASVKSYSIEVLAENLSKLTAKSVVEENATDLNKYGLDAPEHKITGIFGGETKTFYAGNATTLSDGYYFKDADSDTVYTIYPSLHSSLFCSKESYRDITFLKVNTSSLAEFSVKTKNSDIRISLMENPVLINGNALSAWEMTSPVSSMLDDSRFEKLVLDYLPQISVVSVVSDNRDWAKYGLNNPYATITMKDTEGISQTIKISPAPDGTYYATTSGDTTIYSISGEPLVFVDVKAFDLVSKFAHICSINDVSSISVTTSDAKYNMSISEGDEKIYKLNDKELSADVFKQDIYQSLIGLICTDFCSDASYKTPDVTIEYTMADKTKVKVEFVNYNDRNYAVYKDGVCSMQILKKEVNSMLETLKKHAN